MSTTRPLLLSLLLFVLIAPALLSVDAQESVDLIVAVSRTGTQDRASTSPDAETWTDRTTTDRVWHDVTYSAELGRFAAIGADGYVMYSDNGVNWTETQAVGLGAATAQETEIVYAEGLFVATGDGNGAADCSTRCIATSPNAANWTLRDAGPVDARYKAVGHNGTGFLAAGFETAGSSTRFSISSNGFSWTQDFIGGGGGTISPRSLDGNGDTWVIVGEGGTGDRIRTSTNGGVSWSGTSGDTTIVWTHVAYEGGQWIAVGGNSVATSSDGVTWNIEIVVGGWEAVTWVADLGVYVAVASDGDIATSADGTTWDVTVGVLTSPNQWKGVTNGFAAGTGVVPSGGLVGGDNIEALADSLGVTSGAASFFMGLLLVSFIVGGVVVWIDRSMPVVLGATVISISFGYFLDFFPLWFLVLTFTAFVAIVAVKSKRFFEGGG